MISTLYIGTFADNLAMAGKMTLLGLGTVFLVLAILWGVMVLFKLVMHDLPEKRAAKAALNEAKVEAPVTEEVQEAPVAQESDDALIAVITAAVAAYRATEGNVSTGFRVVSFKRSGK